MSSSPTRSVRFELQADAEPGLLPRLLVPFARRDLLPDTVEARRHGSVVEALLEMHDMPAETIHLVEGNLRQIVGVRRVAVVPLAPPLPASLAPSLGTPLRKAA